MSVLRLDIETRSRVDLRRTNVYRYAECPDFKILMAAWAYNDEPVEITTNAAELKELLWGALDDDSVLIEAHNAPFERVCFSQFMEYHNQGVRGYLPPEKFDDTMVRAAEWGVPERPKAASQNVGCDREGRGRHHADQLVCKPDLRTGKFRRPQDHPEKWEQFKRYCVQDVETLREVSKALPDWPANEREECG